MDVFKGQCFVMQPFNMQRFLFACAVLAFAIPVAGQKPTVFDVSDVVVGAQRIPSRYLYAVGKWSDAGDHVAPDSTSIQCYKALGFCDVASAHWNGAQATADLSSYDILRWDAKEIIAVDSSPVCIVNTLRADLETKRVTLSSASKGETSNPICKSLESLPTEYLLGFKEAIDKQFDRSHPVKQ